MIKRSIHLEDVIILNMCAPNNRISKHRKQKTERTKRINRQVQLYLGTLMFIFQELRKVERKSARI